MAQARCLRLKFALSTPKNLMEEKGLRSFNMAARKDAEAISEDGDPLWLEAIHQQWVATFDAIRDAIVVVDRTGKILRANRCFAELAQRPLRTVVGQHTRTVAPWLIDDTGSIVSHPVSAPNSRVLLPRPCKRDPLLAGRVYIIDDVTAEQALAQADAIYEAGQINACIDTVATLSRALELVDPYTAKHGEVAARLARKVARELGYDELEAQGVYYGALIHDLGKLSVPVSILTRPGRLSPAEMNLVRMHP
jgi:HD-GYP domain-containing protein (c-di-GMP phosphodiesterase class II)